MEDQRGRLPERCDLNMVAERMGFEPMVLLQGHAISSRAYSSTLAPLRGAGSRQLSAVSRQDKKLKTVNYQLSFRGEGGIRTHDEIAPILVFETSALSRSATSPARNYSIGRP